MNLQELERVTELNRIDPAAVQNDGISEDIRNRLNCRGSVRMYINKWQKKVPTETMYVLVCMCAHVCDFILLGFDETTEFIKSRNSHCLFFLNCIKLAVFP